MLCSRSFRVEKDYKRYIWGWKNTLKYQWKNDGNALKNFLSYRKISPGYKALAYTTS